MKVVGEALVNTVPEFALMALEVAKAVAVQEEGAFDLVEDRAIATRAEATRAKVELRVAVA